MFVSLKKKTAVDQKVPHLQTCWETDVLSNLNKLYFCWKAREQSHCQWLYFTLGESLKV